MSLAKHPSQAQVREYLEDTPRGDDEDGGTYLRRVLRDIILANTQATVAQRLGIQACNVANACQTPRVTLDKVCRMAGAVGCDVILSPRPEPGAF